VLALGALGVVFGDIGTSPLYAMRTILGEGSDLSRTTVYGMTSLVIWALLLVVTALYVGLLLGTDNEGEGGLLALPALLRRTSPGARMSHWRQRLFLLIDRLSTDRVDQLDLPRDRSVTVGREFDL
jgi:K+ transporter